MSVGSHRPQIVPPVDAATSPKGTADLPPQIVLVCWGSFMAQSNGSHIRVASLLETLRTQVPRVAVYSYRNHSAEPWTVAHERRFADRFPGTALILDHETSGLRFAKKCKETLITLFPSAAARILSFGLPGQAPGLKALVAGGQPVFVVNYVDGLARLNGVVCSQTVVETHDVKFVKRAKMDRCSLVAWVSLLRLRNEIASLAAARGVVAISHAEAAFFRMMLGSETRKVSDIPIYGGSPVAAAADQTYDYDMLFTASENPLNERGFLNFLNENSSWVSQYRIALCGRICESGRVQRRIADLPNVIALGFVEDLASLYQKSKVCLSPTDGTGLKIKVVEALRHGKPVFASQHSIEGLAPGYGDCVFPIDAAQCRRLLDDSNALSAASGAATRYYRTFASDGDRQAFLGFLGGLAAVAEKEAVR